MKLLQVNVTANWGSTGRIAEDIGNAAIDFGWESWIAYGQHSNDSKSNLIKIGSKKDLIIHGLESRLLDRHGLASKSSTLNFIARVKDLKPDIIHLHNIHGYYLNFPLLFDFLKEYGAPVVWTLHDCWAFTGHCAYYDFSACDKWEKGCFNCPQKNAYPASLIADRSKKNYNLKKESFNGVNNMTIVPVSDWLLCEIKKSFLKDYAALSIHNGVDLNIFYPRIPEKKDKDKNLILGVASVWEPRKGLDEFKKIRNLLPLDYNIILVGLSKEQLRDLPEGIIGIERTENIDELAKLYSAADVFVNPTFEDNFPTTNLEALACGTPVVTYATGGSPEAIDANTGIVVEKGDVEGLKNAIMTITSSSERYSVEMCRERAIKHFDKKDRYADYLELYAKLLAKN